MAKAAITISCHLLLPISSSSSSSSSNGLFSSPNLNSKFMCCTKLLCISSRTRTRLKVDPSKNGLRINACFKFGKNGVDAEGAAGIYGSQARHDFDRDVVKQMDEESGGRYTLDEALSAVGFGKFQVLALAFAGLGWISDAMEMMLLSFIGPALQTEWNLSPGEESFLSTIVFLGMLIGAYFFGSVSDTYGRRAGFIGADLMIVVSGILSALAPNYMALLIFRCFLGIGVGGAQVFATWFLEFIPTSHRGSWMVAISLCWSLGTVLEASLAWIIMPRFGWRWLLGVSCIPSLTVLLISGFAPESPRFLCVKGRFSEARRVLEKVARVNQTAVPSGSLICDPATDSNEGKEALLSSSKKPKSYPKTTKSPTQMYLKSLSELFSPALLRTTLLVWFLYFAFTFSYYGIVLITTELSSGQNECGSVILPNGQNSNLYVSTFITSTAELPGLLIVAIIVDKLGRRLTMQVMTLSTFAAMLPLLWHQNGTVTTVLLFVARMFVAGGFSIANVYSKEVYPTTVRSTGDGIANAMGRIGGMVCPLVAVGLVRGCYQTAAVGLFEAVLLLSGFCILLFPIETKGKELADTTSVDDTE